MSLIAIGPGATERASQGAPNYTQISKINPANETGLITSVEVCVSTAMTAAKIATFYVVSGNYLTARDEAVLGDLGPGKQTINGLSLQVQAGDYIGLYFATGTIKMGTPAGSGRWHKSGDQTACLNTAFNSSSTIDYSLGGSGDTGQEIGIVFGGIGCGIGIGIGRL